MAHQDIFYRLLDIPDRKTEPTLYDLLGLDPRTFSPEQVPEQLEERKKRLRQKSVKEGLIVYGDWNGRMKRHFGFRDEVSNFLIIDRKGIIRYYHSGRVSENSYGKIKNLLHKLAYDE